MKLFVCFLHLRTGEGGLFLFEQEGMWVKYTKGSSLPLILDDLCEEKRPLPSQVVHVSKSSAKETFRQIRKRTSRLIQYEQQVESSSMGWLDLVIKFTQHFPRW